MPSQGFSSAIVEARRQSRILRCALFSILILLLAGATACSRSEAHFYGKAEGAQRVGSYDQAVQLYQAYLKKYPHGEYVEKSLYNLGNIYYLNLRDSKKARGAYEDFLNRYPNSQYAFTVGERLAELYERDLQDFRKAIDVLEQISMRTPSRKDWRRVRFEVANDYFRLDEFDQSIVEFNRLIQDQPNEDLSDQARIKIAAIYEIRKQWREAIGQLQQVINQSQCRECRRQAEFELVDCYAALERYDQAIAAIKQITPRPEDRDFLAQRLSELEKLRRSRHTPREVNWRTVRPRRRRASK